MRIRVFFLMFLTTLTALSQPAIDLRLKRILADTTTSNRHYTRTTQEMRNAKTPVIIKSSAEPTDFGKFQRISEHIYTARLSRPELMRLVTDSTISHIAAATRHRLLSDRTRAATGVDRIHRGEGIDAPFTGRGVIIGMIDEGFEYQHIAFSNAENQSRVKYVWNRRIEESEPTTVIPAGGDGYTYTQGHATHTASIAAGRTIPESKLYGMAPDAELIFIPSNLDNAELLEDAAFVSSVARSEGKPWILNISFGSHDGPHDGRDLYSQTMNDMLLREKGFLVAAMGNEGGKKFHASGTLAAANKPLRFLLSPQSTTLCLDVWAQKDDSLRHTVMRPFVLVNGEISYNEVDFSTAFFEEINPDNRKQRASLYIKGSTLNRNGSYLPVGIEVSGTTGTECHAWTDEGFGEFYQPDERFVKGDDLYLVCEGGACVPSAIAVGAYAAANSTERLNGSTVSYSGTYPLGEICDFSNSGPYLGSEPKPTVAAPGAVIRAAVSKATPEFSPRAASLVESHFINGETFYYGHMSGTSMAAPVVTGILALGLEAYPLSHAQLMEILRTTSHTQTDTQHWGYGSIDAYVGLQAVLQLAEQTGIDRTQQHDFPAALQHQNGDWHVLACRNLQNLQWKICDTAGRTICNGTINSMRQGQDIRIAASHLPHGIYLFHLAADGKAKSKKFVH